MFFGSGSGRPAHEARIELLDRADAALLHGRAGFGAHEIEYALDAFLAEGAQPPEIWPADADRLRAHRERLDRIGAAPKAAVDDHGHAALYRGDDLRQRVDGGAAVILAPSAVVGDENAIHPVLRRKVRVFGGDDALEHDLHLRDIAHPFDGVPRQVRGLAAAGNPGEIDAVVIMPPGHP